MSILAITILDHIRAKISCTDELLVQYFQKKLAVTFYNDGDIALEEAKAMFPSESAGSDFEQFWGDNAYIYFRGEYSPAKSDSLLPPAANWR